MPEEEPHQVHPIIREALEIAYMGVEPVEFDNEAIEELTHSLANWFGHPDLKGAVVDLINFAWLLREQGAQTASLQILCLVATATDALEALNTKERESKSEDSL